MLVRQNGVMDGRRLLEIQKIQSRMFGLMWRSASQSVADIDAAHPVLGSNLIEAHCG